MDNNKLERKRPWTSKRKFKNYYRIYRERSLSEEDMNADNEHVFRDKKFKETIMKKRVGISSANTVNPP